MPPHWQDQDRQYQIWSIMPRKQDEKLINDYDAGDNKQSKTSVKGHPMKPPKKKRKLEEKATDFKEFCDACNEYAKLPTPAYKYSVCNTHIHNDNQVNFLKYHKSMSNNE